jgi:hypothetical protein
MSLPPHIVIRVLELSCHDKSEIASISTCLHPEVRAVDMTFLLSDTTTLQTLFTTLLSGAILIVSVVTSISSIVLSQEITDLETEQERIDAAIEFRRRTEEMADVAGSPGQPAAFLDVILYTIYHETRELRAVVSGSDNREFNRRIESLTDEILAEAKSAARTLDGAKFGTFKVLSAGLKYDYSWQLNTARRIETGTRTRSPTRRPGPCRTS